jgi:hypothetical protein
MTPNVEYFWNLTHTTLTHAASPVGAIAFAVDKHTTKKSHTTRWNFEALPQKTQPVKIKTILLKLKKPNY